MDTTVAKRIFKEKGIGNDAIALFFYLQYSTQAGRVPGLARQTKALTKFEKEPFVVLKELGYIDFDSEAPEYILIPDIFAGKANQPTSLHNIRTWHKDLDGMGCSQRLKDRWLDGLLTYSSKWALPKRKQITKIFLGTDVQKEDDPVAGIVGRVIKYFESKYFIKYRKKYIYDWGKVFRETYHIASQLNEDDFKKRVDTYLKDEFLTKKKMHSLPGLCRRINEFEPPEEPNADLTEYEEILRRRRQARGMSGIGNP